jgi:hypothetical protein
MICIFKKYKNLLGVPKKGIHRFRIDNVAIVDYLLTLLVSFITSYITNIPVVITTVIWFLLGIFLHVIFGVTTSTTKYLNIGCK